MTQKKGLVGKELKPASSGGAAKPGMAKQAPASGAKPPLGSKLPPAKDLPAKTGGSRNLLSVEEVAERLRVEPGHVQAWIKDGILKGSASSGVQLYELEKFRAKHHREIQQAQNAPVPAPAPAAKPAPKQAKTQGKKASSKVDTPVKAPAAKKAAAAAEEKAKKQSGGFSFHIFKQLISMFFSTSKPDKTAPYVLPEEEENAAPASPRNEPLRPADHTDTEPEIFLEDETDIPVVADVLTTSHFNQSMLKGAGAADLQPPPPPSQEVWPSLEKMSAEPSPPPAWLNQPAAGLENETLILRADQIARATQGQAPSAAAVSQVSRELQEEKQRNQDLLAQLQDQRRAELELQDEIETLKQRLELSLNGEREVRAQLKRSRQELQAALEELDQRPPAGNAADGENVRALEERCSQLEAEKSQIEQLKAAAEQQKSLLETQIERLRAQAEEIRQHGLQWHQLATQQDGQLRQLRQQHAELEQEASRALDELEARLQESESSRARAEATAQHLQQKVEQLTLELQNRSDTGVTQLQQELKVKERAVQQLQFQVDQLQGQLAVLETQQRNQTQRWEQELQASASWVQKLTEAVTVRDRRISELESQLAQSANRTPSASEEELKSQVMSLRVELTSLRRNYEIVSLQAKNLENQLQESRRAGPAPTAAPAPPPTMPPPMLTLDLPISNPAPAGEDEGGFRRRLNARLRSLGTTASEDSKKRGLEPPPFLELDIPES